MAPSRIRAIALRGSGAATPAGNGLGEWVAQALINDLERERLARSGFLWLPVAFGLGILAYFQADREPELWAAPLLAMGAAAALWNAPPLRRTLALGILMAALGFAAGTARTLSVATPMIERPGLYVIKGYVEQLDSTPRRHRLTLRPVSIEGLTASQLPLAIRVGVSGPGTIRAGAAVELRARLAPPAEASMPGGYDFRREAFFRGIGASGFALGRLTTLNPQDMPVAAPLDLRIKARIDDWRNSLTDRIARRIGGEAGALSAALVTGKRGLIPEETNDDLRASGLYHVVSISGLHMVLAAGIFFWIARAGLALSPTIALRWPIKKIAAGIAMLGATFYCIFSGSEVATERSLIMTLVMLGAILFDRPALAMRNLALSAILVLAREPESLLGPSFQMSFAAVACLIAANQIWQDWQGRDRTGPPSSSALKRGGSTLLLAFLGIIATTCVASLATAPFGAWHFHRINPLGIIGNALAIPLVSLIVMPSAVIGTLLLPFALDGPIWSLMGEGVRGMLFVANRVANLDFAILPVAQRSSVAFLLMTFAILLLTGLRTRLRWSAVPVVLGALLFARATPLPDIVIDAEGRMALIRDTTGEYRLLAVGTPRAFTLSQWLPALGDGRKPGDPGLRTGIRCDAEGCIGRLASGRLISLSLTPAALRTDCTRAQVTISPIEGGAACPAGVALYDRAHFIRYGATQIFRTPEGWTTRTALDPALSRPWRRPVNSDARG